MERPLILTEALANGLNMIGDRWTLAILREAFYGATRFEEFRQNTQISRATLTRRLRSLVDLGVFRKQVAEQGKRKRYLLSRKGGDLLGASLLALQWEAKWTVAPSKARQAMHGLMHIPCKTHLQPQAVCKHCQRAILYSELQWLARDEYFDSQVQTIKASHTKNRRRSVADLEVQNSGLIDIIADRWSLLILLACFFDTRRFDAFISQLNIPTSILSERLKFMQNADILLKRQYSDAPVRYEYRLTNKGKSLFPFVMVLRQWVNTHLLGNQANPYLVHQPCGAPLELEVQCGNCATSVTADEVEFSLHQPEILTAAN